ncbi:crotonobetainyl-CoA:carnitine CoA-transferase CaiB-like acyl-CoA transferase [Novosphingobium kunmingense]|uniref:Crotonobetainyl-CoA:carnitine CoA-transferase CaiB-like acyl-CoA transferase n=1 Tax=Novosphingobium kunmingense TaxID=1211806 RepID=A0A2N0H6R1_9SPHN|nr:CaiB/BaiF CoA-transferase family protein [Novosphingobium kunmingense]PKB14609.1 crotonobetainyl-CoA:carnitine CoA-transferase CaiB-like acyl-CoA transferase [Novosphingobium kunmingense]
MTTEPTSLDGPLHGLRVLELSRVLAGPWASQMLGDLGADVIKVEQPGQGDDTRRWGPPFLPDGSRDSAYYLCANRNKRSIAIDIARPEGADLVRKLAERSDIVIENFRVGALARYGLDYESLRAIRPDVIYCSVTGFGQDGPEANRGGYDFLIQGMSGVMSVTGRPDGEPGEGPLKTGIPISDLSTGLYATISILAALNHRYRTGEGQYIDVALLDSQVALLANQASGWLNGGVEPKRMGNAHTLITPYQDFTCADGDIMIAVGNDRQFAKLCDVLGVPDLATDPRFAESGERSANRADLFAVIKPIIAGRTSADLLEALDAAKLPCGKVNTVPEILAHPQIEARGLIHELTRDDGTPVKFLGFPGKLSRSPATYRRVPPRSAQHTAEVLGAELGLDKDEIAALLSSGIVADRL